MSTPNAESVRWWRDVPEEIERAILERLRGARVNVDKPTVEACQAMYGANIAIEVLRGEADRQPIIDASGPVFARPYSAQIDGSGAGQ